MSEDAPMSIPSDEKDGKTGANENKETKEIKTDEASAKAVLSLDEQENAPVRGEFPANRPPDNMLPEEAATIDASWLGKLMLRPEEGGISSEEYCTPAWSWVSNVTWKSNAEYKYGDPNPKFKEFTNIGIQRRSWFSVDKTRIYGVRSSKETKDAFFFEKNGKNFCAIHVDEIAKSAEYITSPAWKFIEGQMSAEMFEGYFLCMLTKNPMTANTFKVKLPHKKYDLLPYVPLALADIRISLKSPIEVAYTTLRVNNGTKDMRIGWISTRFSCKLEFDSVAEEYVFTDQLVNKRYRSGSLGLLWVYVFDDHHRSALREDVELALKVGGTGSGNSSGHRRAMPQIDPESELAGLETSSDNDDEDGEGDIPTLADDESGDDDGDEEMVTSGKEEKKDDAPKVPNKVIRVGGAASTGGHAQDSQTNEARRREAAHDVAIERANYARSRQELLATKARLESGELRMSEEEKKKRLARLQNAYNHLEMLDAFVTFQLKDVEDTLTKEDKEKLVLYEQKLNTYTAEHIDEQFVT